MSARATDWTQWSAQICTALLPLDFAVPLHETHLRRRYKVRGNTIAAMIRADLARRTYLRDDASTVGMPFVTLTQRGEALRRDYIMWHRKIGAKIGSLPPLMAAVAAAELS